MTRCFETAQTKGVAVNALNSLTKTEIRILAAAKGGATIQQICDRVQGSPDYVKDCVARLVGEKYLTHTPAFYTPNIKVEVVP